MTRRPNKDTSHLFGWICAAGLLLGFVVYLLWSGPGRAWLCSAGDAECARDWIAALSGWAAIVAAVPTVFFLQRQIADANRHQQENLEILQRHQQENIEISLMPQFAVAHRARVHLRDQSDLLWRLRQFRRMGNRIAKTTRERDDILKALSTIDEVLRNQDLRQFNESIAGEQVEIRSALDREVEQCRERIVDYQRRVNLDVPLDDMLERMMYQEIAASYLSDAVKYFEEYLADRDAAAREFLRKWGQQSPAPVIDFE